MNPEGNAVVYCPDAFRTTNGKTAHGLVRRTARYRVLAVIDPSCTGRDAGLVLDGRARGIPIVASLEEAQQQAQRREQPLSHFVVGLAPDGGRLPEAARRDVHRALEAGLHVDCGLHDYLSDDPELARAAAAHGAVIRDLRKPLPVAALHFYSGRIAEVRALKVALLGTDSAVGKRTTAWLLVEGLERRGLRAVMVGTGQTAWLQGAAYGVVLDSLINDFVAGELEHAVHRAWLAERPQVIVIEGQGSLLHPAYPGGFEILAATRPDAVVLQHAPARREYDGFPGVAIHPLARQLEAIQVVSDCPVVALTLNLTDVPREQVESLKTELRQQTGLPALDLLTEGPDPLIDALLAHGPALPSPPESKPPSG